jgi:hypothetical protein
MVRQSVLCDFTGLAPAKDHAESTVRRGRMAGIIWFRLFVSGASECCGSIRPVPWLYHPNESNFAIASGRPLVPSMSKATDTFSPEGSACGFVHQVHEITRRIAIRCILECNIQIWRFP